MEKDRELPRAVFICHDVDTKQMIYTVNGWNFEFENTKTEIVMQEDQSAYSQGITSVRRLLVYFPSDPSPEARFWIFLVMNLMQNRYTGQVERKWRTPGGTVQGNETAWTAMMREEQEELGKHIRRRGSVSFCGFEKSSLLFVDFYRGPQVPIQLIHPPRRQEVLMAKWFRSDRMPYTGEEKYAERASIDDFVLRQMIEVFRMHWLHIVETGHDFEFKEFIEHAERHLRTAR